MNDKKSHRKSNVPPGTILSENYRKNPFSTPQGYFDDFAARLGHRIAKESNPKARAIHIRRSTWLAAASLVLLASLASVLILRQPSNPAEELSTLSGINVQDIAESGLLNDLDDYTLLEYFPESNISLLEDEISQAANEISDEEIRQYLLESNQIESLIQTL